MAVIVAAARAVHVTVLVTVIVFMTVAVPVPVVVIRFMPVVVSVAVAVTVPARVGPAFGLEGQLLGAHDEVHALQHLGEHVVGLELQVVGLQLQCHVTVAQVVGGAREVEGRAVLGAGAHDHHRLWGGVHADERAVLGNEHVASAHRAAAGQEDAEGAAGGIGGVEAALLAHVPVEVDVGGALEQDRRETAASGDKLVDGQHGFDDNTKVITREAVMTTTLKLTQIGNSVGVILPKEILARLKLEKGDTLFLTDAANGVVLTPYDPALDEQLALGREFMREYRDTFHQLAK